MPGKIHKTHKDQISDERFSCSVRYQGVRKNETNQDSWKIPAEMCQCVLAENRSFMFYTEKKKQSNIQLQHQTTWTGSRTEPTRGSAPNAPLLRWSVGLASAGAADSHPNVSFLSDQTEKHQTFRTSGEKPGGKPTTQLLFSFTALVFSLRLKMFHLTHLSVIFT